MGRRNRPRRGTQRVAATPSAEFDHLEIALADPAIRAQPIRRNIFPGGTGRKALVGQARVFVIDETADHTLPLTHHYLPATFASRRRSSAAAQHGKGLVSA